MTIIPCYAALLAFVYVTLSLLVIRKRISLQVVVGDGGDKALFKAMRAHSNFAEYAPLALILFFFVEMKGASPALVHGLGSAFLVGRISHGFGVSHVKEKLIFRRIGMVSTFSTILTAAGYLLTH